MFVGNALCMFENNRIRILTLFFEIVWQGSQLCKHVCVFQMSLTRNLYYFLLALINVKFFEWIFVAFSA